MTPKAKAIELVKKFRMYAFTSDYDYAENGAENEYYLMKDGEELAVATTDESFIKELGAERLSVKNCDAIYCEAINYGYDLDEIEIEIETRNLLDENGCLILKKKS
jgi:hypothetical protein